VNAPIAPDAPAEVDWTAAWTEALDQLELDVEETERLLVGNHPTVDEVQGRRWVAPTNLGPLPETLVERAQAINLRQLETARRLGLALGATRKESELAHRLSPFSATAAPVYVDHLM
jgi:hypothetical protein